jgi:hypothetical protein
MAALITAGIFLPPVFMSSVGPLGFGIKSAAAAGALSGAVASGGLSILAGEKPKDFLKSAAIGAAMGAIGGKLQQGKFEAQAFARDASQTIATTGGAGTQFASVTSKGIPTTGTQVTITPKYLAGSAEYNTLAKSYGATIVDGTPVFSSGFTPTTTATGAVTGTQRLVEGSTLATKAADVGIKIGGKYSDALTTAAISAGVNTGMTVLKDQAYQALADDPPVALGGSARQYYNGTRNAVANLTRNYISSGTPSGDSTAAIYASMANNLSYGTGSIDYNQNAGLSLLRGISIPTLRYT